ncbi:MAG: radical SAM protein [Gammaproteobacteria bacterium]|nr:radical SAM protein [Gammaproteobacteria bacterium]
MLTITAPERDTDWDITPNGVPRGYIKPHTLDELWFHTGTACNLSCPFCLEGSTPGDTRLDRISLADAKPFIDEAVTLGVKQFSFTGGEPFIVRDIINILAYAAEHRPCLVLTNGTDAVLKRLHHIKRLVDTKHPIAFRISIDFADEARHDAGRGVGNFKRALKSIWCLNKLGFPVSVARQMEADEDTEQVDQKFRVLFREYELPDNLKIIAFPDFDIPDSHRDVPAVTEDCMTRYQTEATRQEFMCAFSKMIIKKDNQMRVYACTLVDDDDYYDMGGTLTESLEEQVRMRHHRCYSCFKFGSSCSEL